MILGKYLAEQHKAALKRLSNGSEVYDRLRQIYCKDGFRMSVQVGNFLYCTPREDAADHYSAAEVGFPNRKEPLLRDYCEDWNNPTGTVYGYVPVTLIQHVILKHGGIGKSPRRLVNEPIL